MSKVTVVEGRRDWSLSADQLRTMTGEQARALVHTDRLVLPTSSTEWYIPSDVLKHLDAEDILAAWLND